jgi:hypothetical protein
LAACSAKVNVPEEVIAVPAEPVESVKLILCTVPVPEPVKLNSILLLPALENTAPPLPCKVNELERAPSELVTVIRFPTLDTAKSQSLPEGDENLPVWS